MTVSKVVAIDGPSGAGKSTVARGVARALGLEVLDTGAMYRAVTLAVLRRGIDPADEPDCTAVAETVSLTLGDHVVLDGEDVTSEIRGPAVTGAVSTVAAHPGVRRALVARQRAWVRERGGAVVEGRDIGTVVFPDAPVKVFLTATDDERARRRHREEEAAAREVGVDDVRAAIEQRDRLDSTRATSPLQVASDAIRIDTTQRDVADVVEEVVRHFVDATDGQR